MDAVRLRFASELRGRWRAWLALALVAGLMAGLVLAAVAGARRTESAYDRFLNRQRGADVAFPDDGETPPPPDLRAIERLPQVAESARGKVFYGPGNIAALAPADGRLGTTINRVKLLEGRLPDPRRVDEALLAFPAAEQLGLDVGSTFPLVEPEFEVEAAKAGIENVTFRVVGIGAVPGEFPPQYPGLAPLIHLTPAFYRTYARSEALPPRDSLVVRLEHGQADVPEFVAGVERLAQGKPVLYVTAAQQKAPTQRSFHLQALALWILAGLVALAATLVLAQSFARQMLLESTEVPTLRALGMTRRQLLGLGLARVAATSLAAAIAAVAVALALSPLTPVGVARTAEPEPGFAADVVVLALGALATIVVLLALAAFPAWRTSGLAGDRPGGSGPASRSPLAPVSALARLGARPALVVGARMALEPGRGKSAVPVRTTLAGLVLAVAAVAAALAFGASLDHLLATPRLYGLGWDLEVTNFGSGKDANLSPRAARLAATPGVAELSIGSYGGFPVDVGRLREVGSVAIDGPVGPPILEGRRPAGPGEVALGTKTMRRAGVEIGDTVEVGLSGLPARRLVVVGRTVLPQPVETRLGEGVLLTQAAMRRLLAGNSSLAETAVASDAYIRLEPGAERGAVISALRPRFSEVFSVIENEKPADIVNFGRVQSLPILLAGILGLLAASTLVHMLVTAVRRRRRELAILKTIGFVKGQVIETVLWEATILAALALAVGVPVGLAAGRFAWSVFADRVGVAAEPILPAWQLAVLAAGTLLVANLAAIVPGRLAAATQPADALSVE